MRVNIIGAGLAGTALAFMLKRAGVEPVIYEASSSIASGASGNEVGLYNPRFAAQLDAESIYYSEAFALALEVFEGFGDAVNWTPCGVLSLMHDERKRKQLYKTAASWGWSQNDMRICSASEASEVAGIDVPLEGLFLPKSGNVSPRKLCSEYARGVEVHLNYKVIDLNELEGDATVLACGIGVLGFEAAAELPLKAVRGQVSYVAQSELSQNLKTVISYSGYIAPAKNGVHVVGATFQPWFTHSDLIAEDNLTNLSRLFTALPTLETEYEVVDNRAAVRTTSRDHFPVVGQIGDDLYISTAHGSHGILTSLKSAKILANKIVLGRYSASEGVVAVLSPERFRR